MEHDPVYWTVSNTVGGAQRPACTIRYTSRVFCASQLWWPNRHKVPFFTWRLPLRWALAVLDRPVNSSSVLHCLLWFLNSASVIRTQHSYQVSLWEELEGSTLRLRTMSSYTKVSLLWEAQPRKVEKWPEEESSLGHPTLIFRRTQLRCHRKQKWDFPYKLYP